MELLSAIAITDDSYQARQIAEAAEVAASAIPDPNEQAWAWAGLLAATVATGGIGDRPEAIAHAIGQVDSQTWIAMSICVDDFRLRRLVELRRRLDQLPAFPAVLARHGTEIAKAMGRESGPANSTY